MMTQTDDVSPLAPLDPPAPVVLAPIPPLAAALTAVLGKIERAAAVEPDPVEMVHDLRKGLKEYRALLRLLPGTSARAARQAAAQAARALAEARDRATASEALDLLADSGLALMCDLHAARAALVADGAAPADPQPLRARLLEFVADARARLAGGLSDEAARVDLVEAVRRGYRAARRGHFNTAIAMHETRKRVVAHRYQMSFLAEAHGGRGAGRAGRAQRLRDMLGAHHDIETLRPMLRAAAQPSTDVAARLSPGALRRLELVMARLQRRLRQRAMKLHRALFHAGSRHFAHKWRRRLTASRAA